MAAVIERHLSGASLRKLRNGLDNVQQQAVGETLQGPRGEFEPDRFQARYGSLPADISPMGHREVSPLCFFLHSETRDSGTATVVPGGSGRTPARVRACPRVVRQDGEFPDAGAARSAIATPLPSSSSTSEAEFMQ